MTFLAPLGLLALLTLPLIIILHLRRERLRRVVVPSLMLWQQAPATTGRHRRLILPRTLLLLLHLLVAGLLALALAHPQLLGRLLAGGAQHLLVVIDTSTSMAAREGFNKDRLDEARARVRVLIDNLNGNDTLSIIAAGPQARLLATGTIGNRAGLLDALDRLEPVGTGTDIAGALALAQLAYESSTTQEAGQIVVLSDQEPPQDGPLLPEQVEWVRVGNTTRNQAIVALAARPRRGGTAGYDVYARIANYDTRSAARTVHLLGDDKHLDVRTLNIRPEGETELTWEIAPGTEVLELKMDSGDDLAIDDTASLSLDQSRSLRTVLVSASAQANPALLRALATLPRLTLATFDPVTYASAPPANAADLTIFDGLIPETLPEGGVLIINPPAGNHPLLQVEAAQGSAEGAVLPPVEIVHSTSGNDNNPLEGLSLGSIDFGTGLIVQTPSWAKVLLTRDNHPLILRGIVGERAVAIWAFDLVKGNLTTKLAFPLLVARAVYDLTTPTPPISLLAGQALNMPLHPRTEKVELTDPTGQSQQIAVTQTLVLEHLHHPGIYTVHELAGNETLYTTRIAVNAGTPLESDLRPQPLPALRALHLALDDHSAGEGEVSHNTAQPVWHWLALAALMVLVFEWIYVHWR